MPRFRGNEDLPRTPVTRRALREALQLASYLWPYRVRFAAALGCLLVSSLMALALPSLAGSLVDEALPGQHVVRVLPWHGNVNAVAATLAAVLAVQALASFLHSYWFNRVGASGLTDLRRDTYSQLICLPMAFFSGRRVGELTSRIAADLAQIQDTLAYAVPHFLRQAALFSGGVLLIALTSGRLTLLMLVSIPPLILGAVLFGRKLRRTARATQDRLAESSVVVEETLQGVASVKAFTNEEHEQHRYGNALLALLAATLREARYRGAFVSFIVFGLTGGIVLVLWYGARLVQAGELSVGELTRFMLYAMFVGGAMGSFAELFSQIQRTLGATQRVRDLLREAPELLMVPALEIPARRGPPGPAPRLRGEVIFEEVSFTYPWRKQSLVLRGLSLAARPGERIALVGPSGAGKSTVVSLLLRFYDPDAGRVLIDGRDARDYALHELRGQIAMVPQDVLLFGGSIGDNIAYGRPGARVEEVEEAARLANADGFIRAFPDGYRTLVGERGVQLSGGQRQRVAIARAILRDPAILVLDEATSSLDSESERLVHQALERLMQGRTSLIIAHRLATVRQADRIFVIKDGAIVETGTHGELMERTDGVYRLLSELQVV
ncbi:MAG TPA: ABC transporter transmembrane domain-containing protein [Gemmataceae bacterium]|nr:ABC transporter transmembrane domain-containing protein [Gemmataceae bacterium]